MRLKQHHFVYAGLAALTVVSALILYIGYVSYSPINRAAAARITRGMTEREVEQILGGPCTGHFTVPVRKNGDRILPARTYKTWHDERAHCGIWFNDAGRVELVSFHEVSAPSPLARIRALFAR